MTEAKEFRAKRAQDNVLKLAREWSKASDEWLGAPRDTDEEQQREYELFVTYKQLRSRLEAACHELVAVEAEP